MKPNFVIQVFDLRTIDALSTVIGICLTDSILVLAITIHFDGIQNYLLINDKINNSMHVSTTMVIDEGKSQCHCKIDFIESAKVGFGKVSDVLNSSYPDASHLNRSLH